MTFDPVEASGMEADLSNETSQKASVTMKRVIDLASLTVFAWAWLLTPVCRGQDTLSAESLERGMDSIAKRPHHTNWAAKGLMTPAAWGASEPFVFWHLGGTFPQAYGTMSDMGAGIGGGIGDSRRNVAVVGILNIHDVSEFNTLSGSLIASRELGRGYALSAGALLLFADSRGDAGPTFYIAFSHASQRIESKRTPGYSRLSYTVGVGNGRFYEKSNSDVLAGRGRYGTGVFGNLSYGIRDNLNLNVEWTGLNLAIGGSWRPSIRTRMPFFLPSLSLGVTDILRTSGDRLRLIVGVSHGYRIGSTKNRKP
jgi:hypothetical protein